MSQEGKKIHIRLPDDVHRKLKVKCAYEDISVQEFVERLLRENLAHYSAAEALSKTWSDEEKA